VLGADDETLAIAGELEEIGTEIVKVVDLRESRPRELVAEGGKGRVRRLVLDGERYSCDLLVAAGGRQPAYSLLAQAGARVEYDDALGVFVPTELPDGVEAVGAVTGEGLSKIAPEPRYPGKGKCFVCICEDVTTKDMKRAIGEGFDSIELAKRYTTTTMGPCQGQALPPLEHPRLRPGEPDVRVGDRHDDRASSRGRRSSSVCSPVAS
jgi:sarcosine oxidase subunit alpha